jgi:hypothetical protein
VRALQAEGLSQRAACRVTGCPGSVAQYKIRRVDDPKLIERPKAIAAERRRFGYRRLTIMLRREGFVVNHKRVHRIYRNQGLQLRPRRKRGVRYVRGNVVPTVARANERWSLDFVHDAQRLHDDQVSGKRDVFSRLQLNIEPVRRAIALRLAGIAAPLMNRLHFLPANVIFMLRNRHLNRSDQLVHCRVELYLPRVASEKLRPKSVQISYEDLRVNDTSPPDAIEADHQDVLRPGFRRCSPNFHK